jgi:DNA (cytosine-5)-methyltransferase 1
MKTFVSPGRPWLGLLELAPPMNSLTCIDLFCGCGGFSLGMQRAGFQVLAGIDFNEEAITVFRRNFPNVPNILQKNLTTFPPAELRKLISGNVDVIIGGPPCQGFSTARQVDGANHGHRLKEDARRHLYLEFLRYVDFFQPKVFVMENVLGIRSASGGEYFSRVQKEARELGYRVHAQVEDCVELGLPQKRRRQLFVGTRLDLPEYFRSELKPAPRACNHPILWEAIGDLPPVKSGEGEETCEYDMERRKAHVERFGRRYLYSVLEIKRAVKLTAHRARPHSDRDLRDFLLIKEGENSAEAIRRGVEFEFPYDKSTFKDRYTRQSRRKACSTIVAHLSKDGLMFIHPTQNRSLTPREAARIQSFPDWFEFPIARTHQFRVIGNAVPPLVSEAVAIAIKDYINKTMNKSKTIKFELAPLPNDETEAVRWVLPLLDLDARALNRVAENDFKRAWYSIAFLYAGLHPDSAMEHGTRVSNEVADYPAVSRADVRLLKPYYEQSGWPVVLENVAKEAWRRYEIDEMTDDEFYCSEAQMAGMCHRSPELAGEVLRERVKDMAA